jgi:hypothetical protein
LRCSGRAGALWTALLDRSASTSLASDWLAPRFAILDALCRILRNRAATGSCWVADAALLVRAAAEDRTRKHARAVNVAENQMQIVNTFRRIH